MATVEDLNKLLHLVEKAKTVALQLNENMAAHILAIVQLEISQRIDATGGADEPE